MSSITTKDPALNAESELCREPEPKDAPVESPNVANDPSHKAVPTSRHRNHPRRRSQHHHHHHHHSPSHPPTHIQIKVKTHKRKHDDEQDIPAVADPSSLEVAPDTDVSDSDTGGSNEGLSNESSLFSPKDLNQVLLFSSMFTADIESQSTASSSALVTASGDTAPDSTTEETVTKSAEELEKEARSKRVIRKAQQMYREWKYNCVLP